MKSATIFLTLFGLLPACIAPAYSAEARKAPEVHVWRVPEGGIQPQALVGHDGTVHLVYFTGDPAHGDLFYVNRKTSDKEFGHRMRVNSTPGSACALGTIRGAQIALGRKNRVYVVWNGSAVVAERRTAPMLFTRTTDDGSRFEAEKNLIRAQSGTSELIDGGGAVASDSSGNVFVFWHAIQPAKDEASGHVYLAASRDDGVTFAKEHTIDSGAGTCGCCGMKAAIDDKGNIFVLYRAADHNTGRDTTSLVSKDHGLSFTSQIIQKWSANQCPMSLFAIAEQGASKTSAWTSQGRLAVQMPSGKRIEITGSDNQNYPALAINNRGDTLVSWVEGAGWSKSGSARAQVYKPSGELLQSLSNHPILPTWSFTSAVSLPDGSFSLIY